MRIAALAARTLRWSITGDGAARGRRERAAVLLEIRTEMGAIGLGEAAPLPGMSPDSLEDAARALAAFAASALGERVDRAAACALAVGAAPSSPAARFAIETALLDALAREHAASLAASLAARGDPTPPDPPCPARAAADRAHQEPRPPRPPGVPDRGPPGPPPWHHGASAPPPRSVAIAAVVDDPGAARRARSAGIRCLKIKLPAGDDPGRVHAIAAAVPDARLRIDANRTWPTSEVADRLAALAGLPIEYVEEPCLDAHRLLATALPYRLALDDSLVDLARADLDAALRSPGLAALVLKPTLLGGFAAVIELAERARRAGVAAIVSHTLEGPVGTAACAELALALAGSHAIGLAAHAALAGWGITVAQLAADHVHPSGAPGLGFTGLDLAGLIASAPR
jgi:L-alanine-DL-glutamate epimerase-like enolase superfamily enzyme